jgi:TonB family protein
MTERVVKRMIHTILALGLLVSVQAQTADTTIYVAVEEVPRFPGCEMLDTTAVVKQQCASQALLSFMYSNIRYPQQAQQEGIEGTVVLSFVVEPDSTISNLNIRKDIGGGCGVEAMRVASQMNNIGVRWSPGKKGGKAVRTQFNLPIRFKIEEPLPYNLVNGDTIYIQFDEPLAFVGGADSLSNYLNRRLRYPESVTDTCIVGQLEVNVLVHPNKTVRILDITDYNNLGFDFWYEAIAATTSTYGKWKSAVYEGRQVPASFTLNMAFTPDNAACKTTVDQYNLAMQLANEGAQLFNEEKQEEGIAKMSEAVAMFPDDANLLILRGQAYLDMDRMGEACIDLSKARDITLLDWYDNLLPFICRPQTEEGNGSNE